MSETVPNSEQSLEETYMRGIENAISRQPNFPVEAAKLQTKAGILVPLTRLKESLGLTEEQVALIQDFAEKAAQAAGEETRKKVATNPLLELDVIMTKLRQEAEPERLLGDRQRLRNTELQIKELVANELSQRRESGGDISIPHIVEDLCKRQLAKMKALSERDVWPYNTPPTERFFYTPFSRSRSNILLSEDDSQLIIDTYGSAKDATSDQASYKALHNIPTLVEGVKMEYSIDFRSSPSGWLETGITFDQDAVLRIAQASNLPPIEK